LGSFGVPPACRHSSVPSFYVLPEKKPKQSSGGSGDDNGGSGGGAMAANCRAPLPQQRKMEVVEKIKNKRLTINRR